MADGEHLGILKQGVAAWNKWRASNPEFRPNLTAADLCLANSYYVYKSPLFHRLVNPGGNGTIWVHA